MSVVYLCEHSYKTDEEITVDVFVAKWLSEKKFSKIQPSTYEHYAAVLKPVKILWENKLLSDLKLADLQKYFDFLISEGLISSAKHLLAILRPMFDAAVQRGYLEDNPTRKVVLPAKQNVEAEVLTIEQQQLFLRACQDERLRYLFQFMLHTGLRPGEAVALRWEHIDFDKGVIEVCQSVRREKDSRGESSVYFAPTKNKRIRVLPLSKQVLAILQQQEAQLQKEGLSLDEDTLIFPTKKGTVLEVSSLNRKLKKIRKRMAELYAEEHGVPLSDVQLPNFTAHSFRHTFATRALEVGVPLKVVSEWLGHSSIKITGDVYSHVTPKTSIVMAQHLDDYLFSMDSPDLCV